MTREEALNKVRQMSLPKETMEILEALAPELAESEDERIRKALIDGVRQIRCKNDITQEQMLAYLEKQKEQKHPDGCFTCDEYKKGYEEGRRNGFTAGYNKAMKEVEQKEQKPECDNETEVQKAYREEKSAGRQEVFDHPEEYGLQKEQKTAEWSEEDTEMYINVASSLRGYACGLENEEHKKHIKKEIDWFENRFKSLRPSWKPSEEQMEAVEEALEFYSGTTDTAKGLRSLYNDLKKL